MSGYGFGICGHKNEYSSGVLCGNWTQNQKYNDFIAPSITSTSKAIFPPSEKTLNNYAPPHDMQYFSGKEIARKNQMSLSHSSLFGHNSNDDSDRFFTVHQVSYGKGNRNAEEDCSKNIEMKRNLQDKASINVEEPSILEQKTSQDTVELGLNVSPKNMIPDFRRRKIQISMSSGSIS